MQQALDFISFVPWQFVVAMLNVFILYRLMRRFLFKPVQEIFRKRQEEIDLLYETAAEVQTKADKDKSLYAQKLAMAQEEAKQILLDSKASAEQEKKRLVEEARTESAHILKKTQQDVQQMQKQAMDELQTEISEMAVNIAQKATKQVLSSQDQQALLRQAILQLEKTSL